MTPDEFYTFQMDGLPDIRNDLDRGNMVVSAVKVRNLLRAFDYVQRLHTSDTPPLAPIAPTDAYSPRTEARKSTPSEVMDELVSRAAVKAQHMGYVDGRLNPLLDNAREAIGQKLQPIAPGSAVYRAAHGTGGGDNG
jgi:hypothetical protein